MSRPVPPFAEYQTGTGTRISLYQGDSLLVLPRVVPPRGVDLLVTSPPYNLGVGYASYRDDRPREEYLGWITRFGGVVDSVLSDHGSFFLNVGGPPSDPWLPWDVARAAGRPFVLQNVVHWVKSIAISSAHAGRSAKLSKDIAVGHYKPVHSDRYLNQAHEYVFHFTRRGDVPLDRLAIGVPYQDASNVARWKGGATGVRCRGNAWFLPYPTIQRRATDRPHPAPFPPELPEWAMRLHGARRIRLAVDPFLGIGSSAIAAAHLGIPFVGADLDPGYLETTERALLKLGCERVDATIAPRRIPASPSARTGRPHPPIPAR